MAAPTLVQAIAANGDGDTVFVITGISATVAGRLLSVVVGKSSLTNFVVSITDNIGNTYVKQVEINTNRSVEIWDCANSSGGVTDVTVTMTLTTVSTGGGAVFHEISGAATSSHTAGTSTGNGSAGPSMTVSSFTPSAANCLIIAGGYITQNITFVAGSGYTLSGAQGLRTGSEYQQQTTATATTAPFTAGASTTAWAECAIAYKEAPAAGGQGLLLSDRRNMAVVGV